MKLCSFSNQYFSAPKLPRREGRGCHLVSRELIANGYEKFNALMLYRRRWRLRIAMTINNIARFYPPFRSNCPVPVNQDVCTSIDCKGVAGRLMDIGNPPSCSFPSSEEERAAVLIIIIHKFHFLLFSLVLFIEESTVDGGGLFYTLIITTPWSWCAVCIYVA